MGSPCIKAYVVLYNDSFATKMYLCYTSSKTNDKNGIMLVIGKFRVETYLHKIFPTFLLHTNSTLHTNNNKKEPSKLKKSLKLISTADRLCY